jgi:hypothetical protein
MDGKDFLACAEGGDQAHAYLWLRLMNSGDPQVQKAGSKLNVLRGDRNKADYDLEQLLARSTAAHHVREARQIIQTLDSAGQEPTRTQITDEMKVYERDVLKTITWQP